MAGSPFKADRIGSLLFDLAPCAVAVIDRNFNIVAANPSFTESYGEWGGRHCYEVFKRQHRPCDPCAARQTFQDGRVHTTEEHGISKDGRKTFFEVKTAPIPGPDGEVELVMEMSVDISRFRTLESQHRLLFERVPCFVTVVDRDLRIVDENWRHQETFGASRGKHCFQTYMKGERPCEACPALRTFADGGVHTHQQQARDRMGEQVHFVVHSAPVHDEFGEISHVIEMATDITPQVKMQRDLLRIESQVAVEKAMGIVADAIEQLSWGLGDALAAIRAGIVDTDGAVSTACARLQRRLDHLASVSAVLQPQPPTGGEVTLETLLARVATQAGLPVEHRIQADLSALVEPELVERCLMCLVMELEASSPVQGGSRHTLIEVRSGDEGELLFELRHRGLGPPADESAPSGLGLVAVKHAIEDRGGALTFFARPGQGITFRLSLPR